MTSLATHDLRVSLAVGVAAGAGVIAWRKAHGRAVDALQWMSLLLVVVLGGMSLALHEPRLVMVKPSFAYLAVAAVMLKRGWMSRYMPAVVREHGGDLVLGFERLWAAVMVAMAVVNLVLALVAGPAAWAAFLAVVPLATKVGLIAAQYATLRIVVRRRVRRARRFTAD